MSADVGSLSDSDDEVTVKVNKNGKTVSMQDPVSEALFTTLQTLQPKARKSIYYNKDDEGWNRDQLRADLRAIQENNDKAAKNKVWCARC